MSKEYFVLRAGRSQYAPGFYEKETAQKFAQDSAKEHPGATYTVVWQVDAYQFPRKKTDA